jgi:hypothetical protein
MSTCAPFSEQTSEKHEYTQDQEKGLGRRKSRIGRKGPLDHQRESNQRRSHAL